jgi:hypothetical protein
MGMLDGKYRVIYLAGALEGVVEVGEGASDRILEVLRNDYLESSVKELPDEAFDLNLKFDTYTLTCNGSQVIGWYAVNVQKLA